MTNGGHKHPGINGCHKRRSRVYLTSAVPPAS
jgi:hypothetical protein